MKNPQRRWIRGSPEKRSGSLRIVAHLKKTEKSRKMQIFVGKIMVKSGNSTCFSLKIFFLLFFFFVKNAVFTKTVFHSFFINYHFFNKK